MAVAPAIATEAQRYHPARRPGEQPDHVAVFRFGKPARAAYRQRLSELEGELAEDADPYRLKAITEVNPQLARHLDRSVTTGRLCSYRPEQPVIWQL